MRLALVLAACATLAHAQTSPSLLLKPWTEGKHVEASASAMILADGDPGERLRLYDAHGRARLDPGDERRISFGFDIGYLDLYHDKARLVDQSIGFAMGVGRWNDWELGVVLALGYAGNNPFADGSALYVKTDLVASLKLSASSSLTVLLDYHGNRSIFPDVPLPAVSYAGKLSDTFSFSAGLPYSSVRWQALPALTLDVEYAVPFSVDVTATWRVMKPLAFFAGFHQRFEGFFIDGQRRERRAFFKHKTVEAGLTWTPIGALDLTLAGGYAFDQSLERGFDARNTDTIADFSSEPFLRAALEVRF